MNGRLGLVWISLFWLALFAILIGLGTWQIQRLHWKVGLIAQREAARLPRGRFILLPISEATHGHGTHTWAAAWKDHLVELLKQSER